MALNDSNRITIMIVSEVCKVQTTDVTSAGAANLGIMPVRVTRCNSAAGDSVANLKFIRTTKGRDHSLFCFGITWVDLK